jgi:hypothetical protein
MGSGGCWSEDKGWVSDRRSLKEERRSVDLCLLLGFAIGCSLCLAMVYDFFNGIMAMSSEPLYKI